MSTAFPYFHVNSTDTFERGKQLGSAAADYVRGSIEVYEETFAHYAGLS